MIDRIKDWKLQIVQLFFPLLVVPIVFFFDIPEMIKECLTKANVNIIELDWYWRVVIGHGKWPLIIVALLLIYRAIRKRNKDEILKQNLDRIVWHSYLGYWACRYLLNYQKISLTRVPIPVQFKLVWENIFKEYEYMEGVTEKAVGTDAVNVRRFSEFPVTMTVNIVLADTYPIDWKEKLPAFVLDNTTVVIDHVSTKGVRYYSQDFVDKVATTVHDLPNDVIEINVFATLNAANMYHIVNNVFRTGGRDKTKRIRIYEQTKDSWVFEGKKYVEIKTGAY